MSNNNITRMREAVRSESSNTWFDEYFIANCIGSQALVAYLHPHKFNSELVDLGTVKLKMRRISNRTGVPKPAETWVYTFESDDWTVQIRAVWHEDKLLRPLKTHCKLIHVNPHTDEARRSFNSWLRSLNMIS